MISMRTNDITNGRAAAQVYRDITMAVSQAHAAGTKAVVCTILPRNDVAWNSSLETIRLALNTSIRGNAAGADVVVDLTSASAGVFADPTTKAAAGSNTPGDSRSCSAYYNSDQVNPVDGGTTVMGNMVYTALENAGLI